ARPSEGQRPICETCTLFAVNSQAECQSTPGNLATMLLSIERGQLIDSVGRISEAQSAASQRRHVQTRRRKGAKTRRTLCLCVFVVEKGCARWIAGSSA